MSTSTLWSLAAEPLQMITSYLSIMDVFALWRTNQVAMAVLASRGALRLDATDQLVRVHAFPKFVFGFTALRSLEVVFANRASSGLVWSDLEALPRSLTSFELRSKDAFQVFYKVANSPCPMKSDRGIQPRYKFQDDPFEDPNLLDGSEATKSSVVDLSQITPMLTTLRLAGRKLASGHALIPYLPDSLTKLTIRGTEGVELLWPRESEKSPTSSRFFKFPASLTTLKLTECTYFEAFELLPTSLTRFESYSHRYEMDVPKPPSTSSPPPPPLPRLPPSLTALTAPISGVSPSLLRRDEQHVAIAESSSDGGNLLLLASSPANPPLTYNNLPTSITELNLSTKAIGTDALSLARALRQDLPLLTSLDCNAMSGFQFDDECIQELSRTLLSLKFRANNGLTSRFFGLLPRGLHTLVAAGESSALRDLPDIDDSVLASLPPRLTRASMSVISRIGAKSFKILPKSLTQINFLYDCSRAIFAALPDVPALQSIIVPESCQVTPLTKWPPQVAELTFRKLASISPDSIALLPRSLTALRCKMDHKISDDECGLLPRTLRLLDLPYNRNISEKGISELPPGLERLSLHGGFMGEASSGKFPRSITELYLRCPLSWTDKCIGLLPAGLVELRLNSAPLLTNACIPLFPRTLAYLSIRLNRTFTPENVVCFPTSLTMLFLKKNVNFKKKHIHLLPRDFSLQTKKLRLLNLEL